MRVQNADLVTRNILSRRSRVAVFNSSSRETRPTALSHCFRRVDAGAGQALEVVLVDRLCFSRRRPNAARNFEPTRRQVEAWQKSKLTDVSAKVVIYEAFVEGKLEAPKYLARTVHDLYFLCDAEAYVALTSGCA